MSAELTNEYLEQHRVTLENLLGQHPKYVDHVRKSTQRELALIDEVLRLRAELDGFKGLWEVVCRDRDDVQDHLTAATARAEKAERERDEAVALLTNWLAIDDLGVVFTKEFMDRLRVGARSLVDQRDSKIRAKFTPPPDARAELRKQIVRTDTGPGRMCLYLYEVAEILVRLAGESWMIVYNNGCVAWYSTQEEAVTAAENWLIDQALNSTKGDAAGAGGGTC